MLLLLPVGVLAQGAGDLDTSFGDDGKVITDFGDGGEEATDVVLQPDGKIVVAGVASSFEIGGLFALARYLPNGTLDTTFGGDGRVTTDVGGGTAHAVALQPDGKIVLAGVAPSPSTGSDFALARYLPNGTLDTTFGGDGRVITDFGGDDIAIAVTLQPDGKIVVAGRATTNPATGHTDFALARYLPNGTLDTTFGGDGRVTTAFFEDHATAGGVVLQPDGKIVATGEANNLSTGNRDFALARYLPNGTLDTTFGGDGLVTTALEGDVGSGGVALQPDSKIVLAGGVGFPPDIALARYLPNGTLDTTFGGDGLVITDFGDFEFATDVAFQPDGKIVATGQASSNDAAGFALVRYHPNGTLDTTFGGDGLVITDVGGTGSDLALALAIQPHDGRLVVAGRAQNDNGGIDFALARFHAITCDGVVVTRVGTTGHDTLIGTSGPDVIYSFGGHDLIAGLGGDDILCGGDGNDILFGGSGNDILFGESNNDILVGGPGTDTCDGGEQVQGDIAIGCEHLQNVP